MNIIKTTDERAAAFALLDDAPARTQGRRVGIIVQSRTKADEPLADAIVTIAQGGRRLWTIAEACQLIADLEACEDKLGRWIAKHRARDAADY